MPQPSRCGLEIITYIYCNPKRTSALLVIQVALYLGYGLGHDILKYYVNNHYQLSDDDIKKGVDGFLNLMAYWIISVIISVLFTLPNYPKANQIMVTENEVNLPESDVENRIERDLKDNSDNIENLTNSKDNPTIENFSSINENESITIKKGTIHTFEEEKTNPNKETIIENPVKIKKSFWVQFKKLMTDPVYLLLCFGILMGSNSIGGQNVSMAVMLETFGIPEVLSHYPVQHA